MPPFAEVFLPFIFLNLKITNMKHLTLRLLFYLALPLLWGCSNDDNSLAGPSANGSLIEFNPTENYKGSYEVSIQYAKPKITKICTWTGDINMQELSETN